MKKILDYSIQIAHGIAQEFGTSCEVVIHDLTRESIESSIVYIENGHVTNRKTGDGPSGIVLESLNKDSGVLKDQLAYLTNTDDGRILKSSTMYIRGDDDNVQYIFSLNFDVTDLISMDNAICALSGAKSISDQQPKRITNNVNRLLDTLIEQSVELVGKPVEQMSKDDRITAIHFLNNSGAFLITRSGDKISSFFGISKFTLYSDIDAARQLDGNVSSN